METKLPLWFDIKNKCESELHWYASITSYFAVSYLPLLPEFDLFYFRVFHCVG